MIRFLYIRQIAQSEEWINEILINKIIQVHFHEILTDNIAKIYPKTNFEIVEEHKLNDRAIKLKKIINIRNKK